ncbi:PAS domain S-box protein [Actimicrobium antarcticum]|uniref:histidine kinase n=1 Tax=Actimicrobium antarcticum TaxID=1051899 RepID=A0ABP7T1U3_9BURK
MTETDDALPGKPRFLTLQRAIVLTIVIGLLVPALLINGLSWLRRSDVQIKSRTNTMLRQNADLLSHGMQVPLRNGDRDGATDLLNVMLRDDDIISISVLDSTSTPFVSGAHTERRVGYSASLSQPISYRDTMIGTLRVEVSSSRLQKTLTADMMQSLFALLAQLGLSVLMILLLLESRLLRPLRQLGLDTSRLARGKLDVPFHWQRLDEIGQFSKRLEHTRIGLRSLFDELARKNLELESDIEKRRSIEDELYEREARFRVLVEYSPIAIIEWDLNFCVIEWNTAAEQIFGYTRQQALGQHASFIIPTLSRSEVNAIFDRLMTGSGGDRSISRNIRADGQRIICQWRNAHITTQSNQGARLLSMAEDVTEKQRAKEAQDFSEAKFIGAFEGNPDSTSIARLSDGMMSDVNSTFERLTGYSRAEAVGKTTLDLGIWHKPEERYALLKQLAEDSANTVRDYSWDLHTRDGSIRTCLLNANLFSVSGETYMMAVIRDVTDQRLMEAQKAEVDRALLRLAQGTQEFAGAAFFDLLVADLAAALRTDHAFIALRAPDDPDSITTLAYQAHGQAVPKCVFAISDTPCEQVLRGNIMLFPQALQAQFPTDVLLVSMNCESYAGAPIRDADGTIIGVLSVADSQSFGNPDLVRSLLQIFSERASAELQRRQTELALRNSEQRFAAIFHSSPVSIALSRFGGDYRLLDVNEAFERLYRRSRLDVLDEPVDSLAMHVDIADRNRIVDSLAQHGRIERFQSWMIRGDGSKTLVQTSGSVFDLAGQQLLILTAEDVTEIDEIKTRLLDLNSTLEVRVIERTEALRTANLELASALQTLHQAQDELVRSEKLAALGALVAGIAHELNTPIGNCVMVASTLADRTREFGPESRSGLTHSALASFLSDTQKASDILVRNLERAADLVTSFKQVAMDQTSSQRRRFSLAETTAEMIVSLSPTIRKTAIRIQQHIPATLQMDSYPGPLGQVLSNLINNALLHGFDGHSDGVVDITALCVNENWIELMVSDDGAGIPAANLDRIFDPFFTTKLGAGGSGLGLHITHNLVTGILGGRIQVRSQCGAVGSGTTFILTLPMTAPHTERDNVTGPATDITGQAAPD